MASKDKLLANAQKFLSKGQFNKAIGEYRKLVDAFPKDVRNRQKLAELFSREKRNEEALTEYELVAKHYTDTGFYLKAIAVYKQMQKLESSRADIYHRLAELNEKQGLVGNALTEYRNLVTFYDKNKMHKEAIEVLEKMAELNPGTLNFLAKLAACYMATGEEPQALEKFRELVALLAAGNEHAKIIKLYDRFLDICPNDETSRLPLAVALVGSGSAEKAVAILKELLKEAPESQEVNRCLAEAYVASRDFNNARLTLKHLLKVSEGDLDLREYYVRVCIDFGEFERARDRLESWKHAFMQAGRVDVLKGFYEQLKESLAEDPVVAATLAEIWDASGETAEPDTQESSFAAADDTEEPAPAEAGVEPLVEEPKPDTAKKATQLPPEKVAAADVLLDLDLEAPVVQVEEIEEPTPETLPTKSEDISAASEDVEIEVDIDLDDLDDLALDFDIDLADEPMADASTGEEIPEQDTEDEPDLAIDAGLYLDLEDSGVPGEAEPDENDDLAEPEILEELEELDALEELEELEDFEEFEVFDEVAGAAEPPGESSGATAPLNVEAELEEIEYYLQQGLHDDAARVAQALLQEHPDLPGLHAKIDEINQSRMAAEEKPESTDFADLMADLRDDDLLASTDLLDAFDSEGEIDEDLAQKTVSELDSADTESHFNLGIAYKEMGLFDDAIAEFEKASKDPSRAIDCVMLTGQCQSEAGATEQALETFKQGLAMDNLNAESRMGLNFELGMLYRMNGQSLEALEAFQLVAEKDSFFRNVSEEIKSLRQELGLGDANDDGPQGDRDRVSYI